MNPSVHSVYSGEAVLVGFKLDYKCLQENTLFLLFLCFHLYSGFALMSKGLSSELLIAPISGDITS